MSGTNTIELYNKETDTITEIKLYRVMSIGHLEEPNEDAQYNRYWDITGEAGTTAVM